MRAYGVAGAALVAVAVIAVVLFRTSSGEKTDFNAVIRPILNNRCIGCHGGVKQAGDFSLLFRADALKPAKSGKTPIVPGDPGSSELLRRVKLDANDAEHMPNRGEKLSDIEIARLERWIEEGAQWEDHWAYVAPKAQEPPQSPGDTWSLNGIDRFVFARLQKAQLQPSARAECSRLIRRVSLDLIGLPPTLEETDAFCKDPSQAAYAAAVDRLLASPRYGERWASMWLDLARYADTLGYESDGARTIWQYRDWVIRAFNRDLPFDQFTIEQLAGDLLPEPTVDQVLATAFHRNTMVNNEGGTDDEEFRIAAVLDRVNTTFEVWQGTTLQCAQCHSHAYDPFRQVDYYKVAAIFNGTADADRADERPLLYIFSPENEARGRALTVERDQLTRAMLLRSTDPDVVASRHQWEARFKVYLDDPTMKRLNKKGFPIFEGRAYDFNLDVKLMQIVAQDDKERLPVHRRFLAEFYADEIAPELAKERERRAQVDSEIQKLKPVPTPVMVERPAAVQRANHLFVRGSWRDIGQAVEPDVPESLPPLPPGARHDRLGLARWLVSRENPLTARVTVNRFWEQLFGIGIVEQLGNFGTQGEPPSDQALLDWLAVHFRDDLKWSVKALLKEIVLSATYQQSSAASPELIQRDPNNRLLARGPRFRLPAEAVRDQALFVTGLLSDKPFGPPVMPAAAGHKTDVVGKEASKGEDAHRRAVYTHSSKSRAYPSFEIFDHADRTVTVSQRVRTNTPLQALVTLNDPVYVEAADALAGKMSTAGEERAAQIQWAYRQALGRAPSAAAVTLLDALYTDALRETGADRAARRAVANAILNLDVFLSKD